MDSGNSGSMQSSSGGDEEYDSRGESISNFLNNNPSLGHFGSISSHNNNNNNPPPPPFLSHHHQQQPNNTFFDPLFPQSSNPQFNNDLIWSRALRSDHNFNNFTASSSAPSSNAAAQLLHHNQNPFSGSSSLPTLQQQSSIEAVRASNMAQPDHQPNVAKNPKKRTRASRRAPTTVLTTDTTNFRQMVQEFTGIPTAPFTGSPYTRRLDLFSTAGSTMRSGHLDSLGPLYPLRPSAQKVQVSPFMPQLSSSSASSSSLLSSSMIDALMPTGNNNNSIVGGNTASASTSTSTNFQLGSNHLGIPKQAQNLFNMQNQILSFNAGASVFNTKSQGGGSSSTINVPSLDELGISHEQQVSANLISGFNQGGNNNISGQARNDGNNLSRLWRVGDHDGGQETQRLRSFDANNSNNNNGGGNYNKLNCSGNASTSEFHPEIKSLENVRSTGEGSISSWACPSD
ncbi:uncharacterized protein LOC132033752 [Lycium ferocissimum]|uniref:uncharacterized protein LOC132033752 n=1 Tax=Lycium ferocissimum TaxID=112874 RepID=UPI0028149A92|nr:uncharacterized protein LOC132033752 [Lycium ferocissimum]XP_059279788.1 uncharacterized protein LOC132033752 [Lycium ferocissimum]XP_059279789.1 uncharacterized protein LOC132033752 [Lycium ferocissimum]XP_059279790.1 uncharacterized protein LOC132033752 [Lycium ferocissimum]